MHDRCLTIAEPASHLSAGTILTAHQRKPCDTLDRAACLRLVLSSKFSSFNKKKLSPVFSLHPAEHNPLFINSSKQRNKVKTALGLPLDPTIKRTTVGGHYIYTGNLHVDPNPIKNKTPFISVSHRTSRRLHRRHL